MKLLLRRPDLRNNWLMPTRMTQNTLLLEKNLSFKLPMRDFKDCSKKQVRQSKERVKNSTHKESRDTKILKKLCLKWIANSQPCKSSSKTCTAE